MVVPPGTFEMSSVTQWRAQMMNSLMLEVSEPHPPITGWVTFLEALGRGSLLGASISSQPDTAVPPIVLTQSASSPTTGAQHSFIHSLRYLLSPS